MSKTDHQLLLRLADRLLHDKRSRNDRRAGVLLFERLALEGDAWAAWKAGDCWDYGVGVPKNRARARAWYEHGAKLGHAISMNNLGVMHWDSGRKAEAAALYRRAARRGSEDALQPRVDRAGARGPRRLEARLRAVPARGAQGHAIAMYRVATACFYGEGTRTNLAQSLRWFEAAASAGHRNAKRFLEALGTTRKRPHQSVRIQAASAS